LIWKSLLKEGPDNGAGILSGKLIQSLCGY
jgi:hypothetical protein